MFKIIITSILAILVSSCSVENQSQQSAPSLESSIENIYLARFSSEFPRTDSDLKDCVESDNKSCLEAYNNVKEAKKVLQVTSDEALGTILDVIGDACKVENLESKKGMCYGGIMSLYFYNSTEHDEKIFERINGYSTAIKKIIFNYDFHWFHNRSEQDTWVEYVSFIEIEWESVAQKKSILNSFKMPIKYVEVQSPWVLRDMN